MRPSPDRRTNARAKERTICLWAIPELLLKKFCQLLECWPLSRLCARPEKLQHHLAPVRLRPMLRDVNTLPGAERHLAARDRHVQRKPVEHGLDMSRHVVRPLDFVNPAGVRRRHTLERG